ncbi:MAG TPA: fibronectin type III domain-containing protein, partial [Terriglobales bacterium]|nr:fibronectin type III domain-containing protein [Terriglobales bacterium]
DTCATPVARIPFQQPLRNKAAQTGNYTDQLPANSQSAMTSEFFYGVSALNPYGRSAGLSNQVEVSAAPTLQAPSDFRAELTSDGVRLSWNSVNTPESTGLHFVYRIYRSEQGRNADAIAGELPVESETKPTLLDRSFEWEKTYDYRATVITTISGANGTEQQIAGEDTPPVRVVTHDVFPPATPTGLQAVFSGPGQKAFIDLVWTPDSEADLAGYNIFRSDSGSDWRKLNSDLVRSPAFRDEVVVAGQRYSYSVSAVDVRGNEGSRSEETSETVPSQ